LEIEREVVFSADVDLEPSVLPFKLELEIREMGTLQFHARVSEGDSLRSTDL
jgi:hypothetical protein